MVAMYAPRGFTTLDNNRIGHLGPVAQFTALSAGAEVFKALGVESHVGYVDQCHAGDHIDVELQLIFAFDDVPDAERAHGAPPFEITAAR